MFSKAAKEPIAHARGSIAGRLIALYVPTTLGMLLIVTIALFWVLSTNLERDEIEALEREFAAVGSVIGPEPNMSLLRAAVGDIRQGPDVHFDFERYIRVMGPDGTIIAQTPGMERVAPANAFSELPSVEGPDRARSRRSETGREFILLAAKVVPSDGPALRLEGAMDVSQEHRLIERYRNSMILLLLLGVGISAALGTFVAHRGLRPLQQIAAAVREVRVDRLSSRLDSARWPRELEQLAAAFDQMLKRLGDSFTQLTGFAADLAHELRTPINVLMGEAEVALSRPGRTADEYRRVIESSREECERIARIIDNLLFIARSDASTARLDREVIVASTEVRELFSYFEAAAEEKGVQLDVEGNGNIVADSVLFRRALGNLISNALRYTNAGGSIRVTVESFEDGAAVVAVADTGIGIAPEHLPHLFDRFYRVDPARTRSDGGAGLGLAIVKSIVQLHGGSIDIRSQREHGTCVSLRFPGVAGVPQ